MNVKSGVNLKTFDGVQNFLIINKSREFYLNKNVVEKTKNKSNDNLLTVRKMWEGLGYKCADLGTLRAIHVAGSKGKGSVCAFIDQILTIHGIKTARYSSPHVKKVFCVIFDQ